MGVTREIFQTCFIFCIVILVSLAGKSIADDQSKLRECKQEDFHYEFTECDRAGGRWRVQVPNPNVCQGGVPKPPVRGKDCSYSCRKGQYLDVQGDQDCHNCPKGTYSLGGGVRFVEWNKLPEGFRTLTDRYGDIADIEYEYFDSSTALPGGDNCTKSVWTPKGDVISSAADLCPQSLVYTAHLVKPGTVSYTYQFTDVGVLFNFHIQNDECEIYADTAAKWPRHTAEGEWKTVTVKLDAGKNVLYWRTIGINFDSQRALQPVLISRIEITGVAYTSGCTPCEKGTYAANEGSSNCVQCPKNTFSDRGSSQCVQCNATQYAAAGSSKCNEKQPCKKSDYYQIRSPCDKNKMTTVMYQWVQPHICNNALKESVKLPKPEKRQKCPPCNPGMQFSNSSICVFCPANQFSDGKSACQECPPSTAPDYGITYQWWHSLPPLMKADCFTIDRTGCNTKTGWQLAGDQINSGVGHADDAYLVLELKLSGFRSTEMKGKTTEISRITFRFRLQCTADCVFYFIKNKEDVIASWTGAQAKNDTRYTYIISKNESMIFRWAFVKTNWDDAYDSVGNKKYEFRDDIAILYEITATNTLEGGAASCRPCRKGAGRNACISCPPGNYLDTKDKTCHRCPTGTVIDEVNPYGIESCKRCGPGTRSKDGVICYSDCKVSVPSGKHYDFTGLQGTYRMHGSPLFTASGTGYYHLFNISLCGHPSQNTGVRCMNNATTDSLGDKDNSSMSVDALVCRTTIIPRKDAKGKGGVLAAQSVSLGDYLVAVTHMSVYGDIHAMKAPLISSGGIKKGTIHFYYRSLGTTQACPNGRSSIIAMHCNTSYEDHGSLVMPSVCQDATCDGCTFQFHWISKYACPICTESDYEKVKGECKHGKQKIHLVKPKGCYEKEPPIEKQQACSIITLQIQIIIGAAVGLGFILVVMVLFFWNKNRKLEYKYMKLVSQSEKGGEGELPAADSCALDDDEEEQYDSVEFSNSSGGTGRKLYNKLKSIASKDESDNPFENIKLTEKTQLT